MLCSVRIVTRVCGRVRGRPLSPYEGRILEFDVLIPPPRRHDTWRHPSCFSTDAGAIMRGAVSDPMLSTGNLGPYFEPSASLRPENSPASTPANVGCKAYYTARNIDIDEACKAMYAPFPRSYEKHCVVIGPLDPACFDGLSRRENATSDSGGAGLPGVSKWLRPKSAAGASASRRGGARPAEAPRLRPADVAFGDDHTPFLAAGYGSRPQGWDMWDPAGGTRPRQLRGDSSNVATKTDSSGPGYVVMFDYGSVVFLHFTQQQQEVHLQELRAHVAKQDRISRSQMKTETHDVVLWSGLPDPARLEPDCTTLRRLDVNLLTIIGTVLGQTVALDHYADLVDTMMGRFVSINSGVERTGKFTAAQKKELFQLVARNNTVSTDVVSKLGILERSEAAWKDKDYNFVWEGLREEFEMDSRFRNIEFKLTMLQQNTNFFIEMLHNQKSTMLEWTIIVLITAEIVVGVCDLMQFRPFA